MSFVPFLLGTFLLFVISDAQSCDSGWKQVKRVNGTRCLKVFAAGSNVNKAQAQELCKKSNGIISGLENRDEVNFLKAQIKELRITGFTWLAGRKKIECINAPLPQSCYLLQEKQYYWEDPSVNGTSAFGPIVAMALMNNNFECLLYSGTQYTEAACDLDSVQSYMCSKDPN